MSVLQKGGRRKPNIAFIGAGMVMQVAHLPFYLRDSRCNVLAVAETRPSLVSAMRDVLGGERVVTDYHSILANADVDAVVLCAPRPAVGPLSLEVIAAKKHLMVEKPMAHSVAQAEQLTAGAAARGILYGVGYMKRYDPGVQKARETLNSLLETSRLGPLIMARFYDHSERYANTPPAHVRPRESRVERFAEWPLWPEWLEADHQSNYAWFMNAGSHDVNLMHFFFPEGLGVVSAMTVPHGGMVAHLQCDGVPISLHVSRTAAGRWLEGGEFLFAKGRLAFSIPCPMDVNGVTEVFVEDGNSGVREAVKSGLGWSFERQATGFLDALTGAGELLTDGAGALADLRLIEAMWANMVNERDERHRP